MNANQISILNALVTFAAENVPGGLSEDEQEVAKIVGGWVLKGKELRPKYTPVYVGWTEAREKIVVYKNVDNESELHIRRPDGQLWAMGPDSEIETYFELSSSKFHLMITSTAWSGEAIGSRIDLIDEEPIRLI